MQLKVAVQTLTDNPPIAGTYYGDAIITCRDAVKQLAVHKTDKRIMYVVDADGVHHVVDRHWISYMLDRPCAPSKVVIYDTLRELKAALAAKGVNV